MDSDPNPTPPLHPPTQPTKRPLPHTPSKEQEKLFLSEHEQKARNAGRELSKLDKQLLLKNFRFEFILHGLPDDALFVKAKKGCSMSINVLKQRHTSAQSAKSTNFADLTQSTQGITIDLDELVQLEQQFCTTSIEDLNSQRKAQILSHKQTQLAKQHQKKQSRPTTNDSNADPQTNQTSPYLSQIPPLSPYLWNYYFINNMRCVWPYPIIVNCAMKQRHAGYSLRGMITNEFPSFHAGYLEHALSHNRILLNSMPVYESANDQHIQVEEDNQIPRLGFDIDQHIIKDGDTFQHITHSHEPPVPSTPIQIVHQPCQTPLPTTPSLPNSFLVINKPSGIPVHATGRFRHNTIVGILQHHFSQQYLKSTHPDFFTPSKYSHHEQLTILTQEMPKDINQLHIVHRLDIATSGLLILATNHSASTQLSQLMSSRQVQKHYLAKVKGRFPMSLGHIDTSLKCPLQSQGNSIGEDPTINILQNWGQKHWNRLDLEVPAPLAPFDGFDWTTGRIDSSTMATEQSRKLWEEETGANFEEMKTHANQHQVLWNGVGVRTIGSYLYQTYRSVRSRSGDDQLNGAQLTEDLKHWENLNQLEIVVDRPVNKHHQSNSLSSLIEEGREESASAKTTLKNDQPTSSSDPTLPKFKLNDNGNCGVMHTPRLTYDDVDCFHHPQKFLDTIPIASTQPSPTQSGPTSQQHSNKPALTVFRGLHYDPVTNTTLIHCMPQTGRTHQIRIHLAHIGFPITNDAMYLPKDEIYCCPDLTAANPQGDNQMKAGDAILNQSHYTSTTHTTSTSPHQTVADIDANQKHSAPKTEQKCDYINIETIPAETHFFNQSQYEQTWKQAYDPGCCFCSDINAGIWEEKQVFIDTSTHPSPQLQSTHSTHSTPIPLVSNLPKQFLAQNPQYKAAHFSASIPTSTTNSPTDLCDPKIVVPTTTRAVTFTRPNNTPSPQTTNSHLTSILIPPGSTLPTTDMTQVPQDIATTIEWKNDIPYQIPASESNHPQTISQSVFPPIPSLDVTREYIYLHAIRYETTDWTFQVPQPDWSTDFPNLYIPCALYNKPSTQ